MVQIQILEYEEYRPEGMNVISLIVWSSLCYLLHCFCEQRERFPESSWRMIEFFWFHTQSEHLDCSVIIPAFGLFLKREQHKGHRQAAECCLNFCRRFCLRVCRNFDLRRSTRRNSHLAVLGLCATAKIQKPFCLYAQFLEPVHAQRERAKVTAL